jgi:parallel beta-helix repeat protein
LHRTQGGIWPGRTGVGQADLVPESFYYDSESQTLYVMTATDITRGPQVEVSTRSYLLIATGVEQFALRGIRFEHANTTSVSQSGALTLVGNRLLVEDVVVAHVDGAGIDITGDDNVIARSSANHCGVVGLKVRGRRARVIDNESSFNNTRGFNKWWEAGGAKFVGDGGLQDSEVSGHRAYANQGDGIWFDWRNNNNRIHDNVSAYNTGIGIHYEASHRGLIYDNYVYGNEQRGIYLPNSSHSIVAHNLVAANGMEGIVVVDDRQVPPDSEFNPTNNVVIANVVAWNSKSALVLPVAAANNRSDANVFIGVETPTFSSGWPTRIRPIVNGLDAWRALSGQDSSSQENRSAMKADLQEQLKTRKPLSATMRRALNSLLATTSTQFVPEITGIDSQLSRPGSKPGPGATP